MLEKGVNDFVEIGPGRVLGGLLRRIDRNVSYSNVEDMSSLEKTLEKMSETNTVS
jgi:[acyl-carrier-protein] S-malonyltransferase